MFTYARARAPSKRFPCPRTAVTKNHTVTVVNKAGEESEIKFGACVWATGIAMNPLVKQLQEVLPGQTHFRSLLTDEFLRVKGSDGSIWAFGDAATVDQPKAGEVVDRLFEQADRDKVGGAGCVPVAVRAVCWRR